MKQVNKFNETKEAVTLRRNNNNYYRFIYSCFCESLSIQILAFLFKKNITFLKVYFFIFVINKSTNKCIITELFQTKNLVFIR